MSQATSQPSALNPTGEIDFEEVVISGTRMDRQGELEQVIVGGTRLDRSGELEEVIVTGTNAPLDGQKLEGVIIDGTRRKKSEPKHLYYPKAIADPTGEFKNAIQFTIYQQVRSEQSMPSDPPRVKQIPEQFARAPRFPVSPQGAAAAFGVASLTVSSIPVLGGAAKIAQDLGGLMKNGFDYFSAGQNTDYGKRTNRIEQTVTLYMPDTLVNQDKHDYQPISITQATGRAGLLSQMPAIPGSNASRLGGIEVAAELATQSGILGTRATEAVLAGFGYAINPMLEMIYGGSMPREFLFQFRFAPRNRDEADEVLKIIKTLRYHAATELASGADTGSGTGTRYAVPPNHIEIQFLRRVRGRFQENLALPRIATCVLAGINTNYAAQLDTFTTTPDGIPTSISLDLTFVETVVLTKSDIGNGY